MNHFKIGDRVKRINRDNGYLFPVGHTGIIREISSDPGYYTVALDGKCLWMPRNHWQDLQLTDTICVKDKNMAKFLPGEKIIGCKGAPYGITKEGWMGTVKTYNEDSDEIITVELCNGQPFVVEGKYFNLLNPAPLRERKNNNMNIKEKFVLAITPEPQKSFRKAGITNGDDMLTEDGQKVFLSWLLTQNAEAFKTAVVDELLKEDK